MITKITANLKQLKVVMLLLSLFSIFCWLLEINGTETNGKMKHNHHNMMMTNTEMGMNTSMATDHSSMEMDNNKHIHNHNRLENDLESHTMHMTFYFGVENVQILFEEWTINSTGGMIAACIAVCMIAMLYEGLKVLRETLLKRSMVRKKYANVGLNSNSLNDAIIVADHEKKQNMCSLPHVLQTVLHLLQVSVSYALMLIFMSYNGYLAISIIFGAGLGYFLFGWKKSVIADINEHCH